MKKILIFILLICGNILMSGQRTEGSENIWLSFQRNRCVFELMYFGGYKEGVEQNRFYPQNVNKNECLALIDNSFYHLGTLDGDFVYEPDIQGSTIYLSNKRRVVGSNVVSVDTNYSGWIKLVWKENREGKVIIYTIDKFGTYRYFQTSLE